MLAPRRRRFRDCVLVIALTLSATNACARRTATVMPMRDIPAEQQERDRDECARYAGSLDVTKPIGGALTGQWLYAAAGAAAGLLVALPALNTSDPKEAALIVGGGAAVGAALGFGLGTAIGWKSGLDRAHDEYVSAYADCMRGRGYSVSRGRR